MFYGSGAGKLPTASAVVGDIVEAAKNPNRSMMAIWEEEKLQLEDKADTVKRYFVRFKGMKEEWEEKITQAFGNIKIVELEDKKDEFAFVTDEMSEGVYEEKASAFTQICQMIRVK
jgi:homoserine dehydrogenase